MQRPPVVSTPAQELHRVASTRHQERTEQTDRQVKDVQHAREDDPKREEKQPVQNEAGVEACGARRRKRPGTITTYALLRPECYFVAHFRPVYPQPMPAADLTERSPIGQAVALQQLAPADTPVRMVPGLCSWCNR